MTPLANRSIYVKSPWQFEVRDNPITSVPDNYLLVKISACSVCGSDYHLAASTAEDWKVFGHEVSGIVHAVGEGVTTFKTGDRIALDSSAPCGKCAICLPEPYGKERPDLCRTPATYWDSQTMGFGDYLLTPYECAVKVPDGMSLETASLVEPLGVSIDLVRTAEVKARDRVLIIGPGPLGLGAITASKRAGAEFVAVSGLSAIPSRLKAASALGADLTIESDKTSTDELAKLAFDKVLVTAPPKSLLDAMKIVAFGGIIGYIGIAFGPGKMIEFDADEFHFKKLSLKASFASPGIHASKSITLLKDAPELGKELISHKFTLDDFKSGMNLLKEVNSSDIRKLVMVND